MFLSEYITTFVSIIVGLAVADLLISLHRLLRARKRVTWYWIPPALAIYMLLLALNFWWGTYFWVTHLRTISMLQFVPVLLQVVVLFLFVASVLPDDVPSGLNLKQWYFEEASYIWSLAAILLLLITAWLAAGRMTLGSSALQFIRDEWWNELMLLGALVLTVVKRPWLHSLYVVVAIGGAAWEVSSSIG